MEGNYLDTTHPEWMLTNPAGPGLFGIDMSQPAAVDWMIRYTSIAIQEMHLDVVRHEAAMNLANVPFWTNRDSQLSPQGDRKGATEILYHTGLYRFWDAVVDGNPHAVLDICAVSRHGVSASLILLVSGWRADDRLGICSPR